MATPEKPKKPRKVHAPRGLVASLDPTLIRNLLAVGHTAEQVAQILGVSRRQLFEHHGEAISHGVDLATAAVVGKLFELCMAGNPAAIFFWLKNKAGWDDRPREIAAVTSGRKVIVRSLNERGETVVEEFGFDGPGQAKPSSAANAVVDEASDRGAAGRDHPVGLPADADASEVPPGD